MAKQVLIAGASGFVGSHLAEALEIRGYSVLAMTRNPDTYSGAGKSIFGDVYKPESLSSALADADAAYYLVHSLAQKDFVGKDAEAAHAFGAAAAEAGLERLIYLGGLGQDGANLSAHLKSRREVEHLLAIGGVPVTVLRAAIIIGHGSISWEITRQLVAHLPVMVVPKWATTRTQPIALSDVIDYLVEVLEPETAKGRVFEIGGPDVLTYAEMMRRVAHLRHHRRLPMFAVPLLTPRLSSYWLSLVTDVDTTTARHLVDSMSNEVVVTDNSIAEVVPATLMGYDDAVREAFRQRAAARAKS
jgi:uncharacterized protein YbjT (DUF2867 family)